MSKTIEIDITDDAYEMLLENAKKLREMYIDVYGNQFESSEHDIICRSAELGIVEHIVRIMNLKENVLSRKRGAQNE